MSDSRSFLMQKPEEQLLACLKAYRLGQARAEQAELAAEDWRALYRLSAQQKLSPVVYETLYQTDGFCGGDEVLAAGWKRETVMQAMAQAMRTQKLLQLTGALDAAEVNYAVVKGILCRSLYEKSDLRTSGDEDILISRDDFPRCREVLLENGMRLSDADEQDDVTHWLDERTGLHVELHTALFSSVRREDRQLNRWFSQALSDTAVIEMADGTVRSLQHSDHFLFLVCHALKHFISGGFGVRTLCDIVSYAERYQNEIDHARVCRQLQQVNGRVFLDQIFAIGQTYLAFDMAACGWTLSSPAAAQEMLEDCLDAGIYGQTSMSRRHSAALVLEAAEGGQDRPSILRAAFPPRQKLVSRYPVLQRAPVLLPVIWLRRLGSYGLEIVRTAGKGNSPGESISMGKKRTEMMIRYGIIPKNKAKNP